MDVANIQPVLAEASKPVPPDFPMFSLNMMAHDAHVGSAKADPRVVKLLEALRLESELNVFDGKMIHDLSVAAQVIELWNLAAWLMMRASTVGPEQALADLTRYLKESELPCQLTVCLSGLEPDAAYEIGPGIILVPWAKLGMSSQKQSVHEHFMMDMPLHAPTSALVREHKIMKRYQTQAEFQESAEKHTRIPVDDSDLYDALMCLALVGPYAPQILASWTSLPEWVPFHGGSMILPPREGYWTGAKISADECSHARGLFDAFCAAQKSLQPRLRLVMQRLVRAMRRGMPVDASIDLGISLEALFLSDMGDKPSELSFRLRTRAARLLGNNAAERREIFRLVGDLYDIRSIAVHTGNAKPLSRGRPVMDVLGEGFVLTAKALRCFIEKGEPDWEAVMFG